MASELRVQNGLQLDFTPDASGATDTFLTRNTTTGKVTTTSTIPASKISSAGSLSETTSSVLTITGGPNSVLGNVTIQVKLAGAAQSGYLSTTDWNTFNNKLGTSLTDGQIWIGNGSNVATGRTLSGDVTVSNTGVTAITAGIIDNADISNTAAIAVSKLAALTANLVVGTNGSGVLTPITGFTTTIAGYLTNITSDVQAQFTTTNQRIVGIATNAVVKSPGAAQTGYAIIWDNTAAEWTLGPTGSGGSVTGPGSSTDTAIVRWSGTGGTSIVNSGVLIDGSNNMTGVASITVGTAGLHLLDTNASHDLIVVVGSNLTADRNLTVTTGDSDRTITLSGNPTLSDWFDQNVKTTGTPLFADVTVSNASGIHILDSDSSHDLILRTTSNLTADRELIFVTGDATRTLTINASGTVYVTGGTDVAVADGGTGIGSYAVGDILYASAATTLSKLAVSTDGYVLTLAAGVPTWAAASVVVGDGNKGDITVSSSGTVWTINADINKEWTGAHTFETSDFKLWNPAKSFKYSFATGAIVTDRTVNIPVIGGTLDMMLSSGGSTNRIPFVSNTNPTYSHSASFTYTNGTGVLSAPILSLTDTTDAGIRLNSLAADPGSLSNGYMWYNSTSNELKARINGATIALGATGWAVTGTTTLTGDVIVTGGSTERDITIRTADAATFPNTRFYLQKSGGASFWTARTSADDRSEVILISTSLTLNSQTASDASTIVLEPTSTTLTSDQVNVVTSSTVLGSAALSGDRTISVSSSSVNASLTLSAQAAGGVTLSTNSASFQFNGSVLTLPSNTEIRGTGSTLTIHSRGGITEGLMLTTLADGTTFDSASIFIVTGNAGTSGDRSSGNIFFDFGTKNDAGTVGNAAFFSQTGSFGGGQKVMYIGNATANATSAPTNGIILHARDSSDGSANSTLALYTEQAAEATATFTQTHRLKIWHNNVEYYISLDAV